MAIPSLASSCPSQNRYFAWLGWSSSTTRVTCSFANEYGWKQLCFLHSLEVHVAPHIVLLFSIYSSECLWHGDHGLPRILLFWKRALNCNLLGRASVAFVSLFQLRRDDAFVWTFEKLECRSFFFVNMPAFGREILGCWLLVAAVTQNLFRSTKYSVSSYIPNSCFFWVAWRGSFLLGRRRSWTAHVYMPVLLTSAGIPSSQPQYSNRQECVDLAHSPTFRYDTMCSLHPKS
jgi:hypothetical protein